MDETLSSGYALHTAPGTFGVQKQKQARAARAPAAHRLTLEEWGKA